MATGQYVGGSETFSILLFPAVR